VVSVKCASTADDITCPDLVGQRLSTAKYSADTCKITRWTVVTAVDVLLELSLIALATFLFSTLQMSRKQKAVVIAGFCFRTGYLHVFH